RHAVGTAPHVLEGVVLRDPRPPAVGAEDDRRLDDGVGHCRSSHAATLLIRASTGSRWAAAPLRSATGLGARISRGPAVTASAPPSRSTTRSASSACAGSFGGTTRPMPCPPT